jgi:hypothetical protein
MTAVSSELDRRGLLAAVLQAGAELDADQVLGLECQQGDADAALNAAAAATCSVVGPGEVVTGTMWDDLQVSACRLLQTRGCELVGLCDVLGMCSAATWACVMCLAQRPTSSSCQHAEAHNTPPCPCPVVDLQAELRRSLEIHELWTPEWEEAWDMQRELAMLYKRAWLEGDVLVTSMQYSRHKSRNASRVLVAFETSPGNQQYYAAEVDYYVQLRQPAAGGSSASSSASSVVMAVLRCFKCRDVTDPDLAELLLTAVDGDFEHNAQTGQPIIRCIPLQYICYALDTSRRQFDDGGCLLCFTPVFNRSKRIAFARP